MKLFYNDNRKLLHVKTENRIEIQRKIKGNVLLKNIM